MASKVNRDICTFFIYLHHFSMTSWPLVCLNIHVTVYHTVPPLWQKICLMSYYRLAKDCVNNYLTKSISHINLQIIQQPLKSLIYPNIITLYIGHNNSLFTRHVIVSDKNSQRVIITDHTNVMYWTNYTWHRRSSIS